MWIQFLTKPAQSLNLLSIEVNTLKEHLYNNGKELNDNRQTVN